MSYISENTPHLCNLWYPASLEQDTNAIPNKMKRPNNDVYDYYIVLLESLSMNFRQKTFKGEFQKIAIFVLKNIIFPRTEKLRLDENTLKTKNTMLAIC